MAIEVIKRGVPPSEKIWEATCPSCKSEMRFKKADMKTASSGNGWGEIDSYYIICPVCHYSVYDVKVVKEVK